MTEEARTRSMLERMIGAARLEVDVFEDVEHDTTATPQAAGVVAIVAVCAAIGASGMGTGGVISSLIAAFVGWLVWSWLTYFIGTRWLEGTADWGEMLRTIGFAQAPGVLYVLGVVPAVGSLVKLAVWLWMLVAVIIAIRQALDFTTGKAIVTAGIGWMAYAAIGFVTALLFGIPLALLSG